MFNMEISAKRHTTSELAQIEIYGRNGKTNARMKNLSATGAFLQTSPGERVPRKGELVRATVQLQSLGRAHSVDAEVIWSAGTGFGVTFLKKNQLLEKMFQRSSSSF
jgi:hypothetical protein